MTVTTDTLHAIEADFCDNGFICRIDGDKLAISGGRNAVCFSVQNDRLQTTLYESVDHDVANVKKIDLGSVEIGNPETFNEVIDKVLIKLKVK